MEEPSVLDYVKARLKGKKIIIPRAIVDDEPLDQIEEDEVAVVLTEPSRDERVSSFHGFTLPWRSLCALLFALAAQLNLEPPDQQAQPAVILYSLAAVMLIWAFLTNEFDPGRLEDGPGSPLSLQTRTTPFLIGLVLVVLAFLTFRDNQFNSLNLMFWGTGIIFLLWAFWLPDGKIELRKWGEKALAVIKKPTIQINISRRALLVLAVIAVTMFFRIYRMQQVPAEMISDQAEKLLDVNDILNGQYSIFFPRNTGREALQFYWTAAIVNLFGTGISFLSLKIGTVLAGLFTLPYIYLLGRDLKNRWVGLLALFFVGIAYWPNVISRFGLRFPFYPLFAAPALYYLIRGLRNCNRNDFLLSGIAIGIGLQGYTSFRIVPFVVLFALGLYFLHRQSIGKRLGNFWALVLLALFAFILLLPLFRYAVENPEMIAYRAFSRVGSSERPLDGPALQIFADNLWKAQVMVFWNNGTIWPHSIPDRPALDVVTAALYFLGTLMLIMRYIRSRHWLDLFLIFSVPLLMMPSILSLAFPGENPSLNRTAGAIIPVFIIAGFGMEGIFSTFIQKMKTKYAKGFACLVGVGLLALSAGQNYDLVFQQYDRQYRAAAWNTTEMGHIIREFADSVGSKDSAWLVGWPHWVDSRLVGINAGFPEKDYAIWPQDFETTLSDPHAKLFLVNMEDKDSVEKLKHLYPQGSLVVHENPLEGKSFYEYFVPPAASQP